MSIINPFNNEDYIQQLSWNQWPNQSIFNFELIQPLKAMSFKWRDRDTHYIILAAECLQDWYNNKTIWIHKGTYCLISLPVKTLETAWMTVPPQIRKQLIEENNLEVVFQKKSKQCLVFKNVEVTIPTTDQKRFAIEQYEKQIELISKRKEDVKIGKEEY